MHFERSELCSEPQHEIATANELHSIFKCTGRYGECVIKDCWECLWPLRSVITCGQWCYKTSTEISMHEKIIVVYWWFIKGS